MLGRDVVDHHVELLALGGNSLSAIRILSRLREACGVELPLRAMFDYPTIAQCAASIENFRGVPSRLPLPSNTPAPGPLSFAQQRLWFLDQFAPNQAFYNIAGALRLHGEIDGAALQRALAAIVERHEPLRTVFVEESGKAQASIRNDLDLDLVVVDLSTADDVERELQRRLEVEAATPFDLTRGPLLRIRLFQWGADEAVLSLTLHHIVGDGWSIGVFFEELGALYTEAVRESPEFASLPSLTPHELAERALLTPLHHRYRDYAQWQHDWLQGEVLEQQLGFWREKLQGPLPFMELPADRPRPAEQSYRGATEPFVIPREMSERCRALARQENVTPFMLLLSAFYVLLYRHTNQRDLLVGTPVAGRRDRDLEPLIGLFVNTVVLRVALDPTQTFVDFLHRVRQITFDGFAHQDVPIEKLVDELRLTRSLSHNPIFQVMFSLENTPDVTARMGELTWTPLQVDTHTATFDLTFALREREGRYQGEVEYNTDLFDRSTVQRFCRHYQALLRGILGQTEQPLATLPMFDTAEINTLLGLDAAAAEGKPGRSVLQQIREHFRDRPRNDAVVDGGRRVGYAELGNQVAALAAALRRHEVGKESLVAIGLPKSPELVAAALAVWAAGGAFVYVDPSFPKPRRAQILEDSQATLLVADDEVWRGVANLPCLAADFESVSANARDVPEWPMPDRTQLAYVIYTSGSTGRPKGVMVEHGSLQWIAQRWRHAYELEGLSSHLQMASPSFDVFIGDVIRALTTGAKLVLCPRETLLDPTALEELIRRERVDVAEFVPIVLTQLLDHLATSSRTLDSLQLVIAGSDRWPRAEAGRVHPFVHPSAKIVNSYGVTEATIDSAFHVVDSVADPLDDSTVNSSLDAAVDATAERDGGLVPVGRPLGGTYLYVLDDQGQPSPFGVPGELYVGGEGVARGYRRDPRLTAERYVPDPFAFGHGARMYRTGDRVRRRVDGVLEFLGRQDHQVKLRGFRIELGEVEATLSRLPDVVAAAAAVRRQKNGLQLIGYVVLAENGTRTVRSFREELRSLVPDHMIPSHFVQLDSLPRTANGKLDRARLPPPAGDDQGEREGEISLNEVESILSEVWTDLLGGAPPRREDNFFECGGDSILSIQFVARARQRGVQMTAKDVFQRQTLAELAAVAGAIEGPSLEEGPSLGEVPLLPMQRWFFAQNFADPHHWNQAVILEPREAIDFELLTAALAAVVAHHEGLRLRFRRHGESWRASVTETDADGLTIDELMAKPAESSADVVRRAQASLRLEAGVVTRMFRLPNKDGRRDRLLWVIHHLIVDNLSWRVLLEDLESAYRQLSRSQAVKLPPRTASLARCGHWFVQHSRTAEFAAEVSYWRRQCPPSGSGIPLDDPEGENTVASERRVRVQLEAPVTAKLLDEVSKSLGAAPQELVLAACVESLRQWRPSAPIHVELEGHGRDAVLGGADVGRTVGWFTAAYPVLFDVKHARSVVDVLKAVKEAVRGVPNAGIGFHALRYGETPESRAPLLEFNPPGVSFNFLGIMDTTFPDDSMFERWLDASDTERSPRSRRSTHLEISASIDEGQIKMEWFYSENLHQPATINDRAAAAMEALRSLCHQKAMGASAMTPSDFPLAGLNQKQLDKVLGRVGRRGSRR